LAQTPLGPAIKKVEVLPMNVNSRLSPLGLLLLSVGAALLGACSGASVDHETATSDAQEPVYQKGAEAPPLMDLPSPPLATVHTAQGTRIDFIEFSPGGGVFATEAGPNGVPMALPALDEASRRDAIGAFRKLSPGAAVPAALSRAVGRRGRVAAEVAAAEMLATPRYVEFDSPAAAANLEPQGVAHTSQAIEVPTGRVSANACDGSTARSYAQRLSGDTTLTINSGGDSTSTWDDIAHTEDFVCTQAGGQYVRHRIRTRPWSSWSTRSDFQVMAGTGRYTVSYDDLGFDYDYQTTVYDVYPDHYDHGASAED
jgi:hypothetical protein